MKMDIALSVAKGWLIKYESDYFLLLFDRNQRGNSNF